ncbi:MAG: hypothetical protein IJ133_00810 [Clostridia bacterium]|nr:hypothetical protein [Clostridia bacterium]
MIVSLVIMLGGVTFALLGIILMYTGRSMTYDRAGKMIENAGQPIAPSSVQPQKEKKPRKERSNPFKKKA